MTEELTQQFEAIAGLKDFDEFKPVFQRLVRALDRVIRGLYSEVNSVSALMLPGDVIWTLRARTDEDERREGFIRFDRDHRRFRKEEYPQLCEAIGQEDVADPDYFEIPDFGARVPVVGCDRDLPPGSTGSDIGAPGSVAYSSAVWDVWIKT